MARESIPKLCKALRPLSSVISPDETALAQELAELQEAQNRLDPKMGVEIRLLRLRM